MRLTPIDLINKRFPGAVRGYARGAVEDFLREVAADYEGTVQDNARLRDSVAVLEREVERYRSIETTLQNALLLAQRTADDLRASAHREADAILAEARARSEREIETARRDLETVRQERARFAREFRALLRAYLDEVGGGPMESEAVPPEPIREDPRREALVGSEREDAGTGGLAAGG